MQVQRKIIDVRDTQVLLELPQSFVNHRVEVIALTVDDEPSAAVRRRRPSPAILGQGRTLGDLVGPIVDPEDWSEAP
ncbi:MAG: hypothetical protein KGI90_13775 [Burkholderiales bacterium]|nr:hypothetical protein [Burkholderiales bacterium]MDE2276157.1 hypothetical protein [Burkholderiales bacterium]